MKKILVLSIFFILSIGSVFGQQHLGVNIDHPVYALIENAEVRGLIAIQPGAKPYSQLTIMKLLKKMRASDKVSVLERTTIDFYLEQFEAVSWDETKKKSEDKKKAKALAKGEELKDSASSEVPGIKEKNLGYWVPGAFHFDGDLGSIQVGVIEATDIGLNFNNLDNYMMMNMLSLRVTGDIFDWLSYRTTFGVTFDRGAPDIFFHSYQWSVDNSDTANPVSNSTIVYNENGGFVPYSFNKRWNGFHFMLDGGESDGYYEPSICFYFDDEIATSFFDNHVQINAGIYRRDWGKGDGSLNLSGTAQPFLGVETHIRFADWMNLSYVFGSLGDEDAENSYIGDTASDGYSIEDQVSLQKMFTVQRLEIMPTDWLYFHATASVVWGKRFELGYMSPFTMAAFYQNLQGDMDNMGISAGTALVIPYFGKIYGSFFLDEAKLKPLVDVRNMLAFQGGWEFPVPKLPATTLKVQYTKIEPFCYAHYAKDTYSALDSPVDLSYTQDGQNIAYYLPPNSDEILVRLESTPYKGIFVALTYKLIRHGTNNVVDANNNGIPDTLIYGDIGIPIDYEYYDEIGYDSKNFLYDGFYDWNNIVTLEVSVPLQGFEFMKGYPVVVGVKYSFFHTNWVSNGTGDVPDPVVGNIITFSLKFNNP